MKEKEIRNKQAFDKYLQILEEDTKSIFDKNRFFEVSCPACGSFSTTDAFFKMGFKYNECSACKTIYVSPRPRIEDLKTFYENSDSSKFWINSFFKPVAEARREKIFLPRARYVVKEFPNLSHGKIGDVGAGFGLFLEELAKIWTNARLVAIEPSLEMAALLEKKNIEVIPKMFEDVNSFNEGSFDLLTSFELFEHLYNPREFLCKAHEMLNPNGLFILTTLNGQGFDIQVLWQDSKSFSPPQHLNFFNTKSIRRIFEECGFEIVNVSTPGKLDWDIVEGMYSSGDIITHRFWGIICDCNHDVKRSLQNWITDNSLSSHMMVVARKG